MSQLTAAPAATSTPPAPVQGAPPLEVTSTYLAPADPFPTALAELALVELLVLHSRITRQLEYEYIDAAGPHPVTLDRAQELTDELDTRQDFLTSAKAAPLAPVQTDVLLPSRGANAAHQKATSPAPVPATGRHATAPGQAAPVLPRQDEKPPSAPLPVKQKERSEDDVRIHDLAQLRPGDRIQIWHRGQLLCVGAVEEVAPALGVMWIREGLDAYRRMIHVHDDIELRSPEPRHGG